ncbi:lytic transglycosylase domain-containing protein [Pelagimonas sp. KU-00592-HH]|uniref:lytic transglycosylase domain-containing protein n=1 Tax=Pelagimonas sp. KU-00592-HH TaxID=3127651 RepID=UPI00334079C3
MRRRRQQIVRSIWAGLIGFSVIAGPIHAETPPPFPEFSAKRIKAPKPGSKPKIDVQISEEAAAPVPVEQEVATTAPYAARYDWFWKEVSPQMSESGPGRLATALQHLSTPPEGKGVSAPRLQALQKIAQAHARDILIATVGTDVSPALVLAVIAVESGGDGAAVSGAGAEGLMQLMPATAERFGVSDSFAADENIKGGVAFLDLLMKTFERDPILVLAGYNAGENAVKQAQGVPEYAETRDYVPKVLAAYAVARGLCRTPPELISDGCVFVTQ